MPNNRHRRGTPGSAIALLQADHQKIRNTFRRYAAVTDPATKGRMAVQAFTALELHAQLETHVFYPAFARGTGEHVRIAASGEEHQAMSDLIDALRGMDPAAPPFQILCQTLMNRVEDHIAAEETALFPQAAVVLADRMDQLRSEMEALKRNLLS